MTKPWRPDHRIDRAVVESLLRDQASEIDLAQLAHVGSGWDHEVWRCGEVVFRFPHHDETCDLAARKASALSNLADRLPCRIPTPTHVGSPTASYPGRFVGYSWIPGHMPAQLRLGHDERCRAAEPLARSLNVLHSVPCGVAEGWGVEQASIEGELALRTKNGERRAAQLAGSPFAELADRAAAAMTPPPPEVAPADRCLVHGDLHTGQLIFDRQRCFVGIIDWDELSIGDPAYDLMLAYFFLPKAARPSFWSSYGPFSGKGRARHLALSYSLAMLAQAMDTGEEHHRDEAALSLEHALS